MSAKTRKHKRMRRREYSSSSSDSEMDLERELKPIAMYSKQRPEMVRQMFRSLRGEQLEAMMPELLKRCTVDEVQRLCIEELSVMSKKRIRYLLDGKEMSSSSGTEETSSEDEVEVKVPLVQADVINSEGEDSLSSVSESRSQSANLEEDSIEEDERAIENELLNDNDERSGEAIPEEGDNINDKEDEDAEPIQVEELSPIEDAPVFDVEDKELMKEMFDVEFVEEENDTTEISEDQEKTNVDAQTSKDKTSVHTDPWDNDLSPSHSKSLNTWTKHTALNPISDYMQEELDYDEGDSDLDLGVKEREIEVEKLNAETKDNKFDSDSNSEEEDMKEVEKRRNERMKHTNERPVVSPNAEYVQEVLVVETEKLDEQLEEQLENKSSESRPLSEEVSVWPPPKAAQEPSLPNPKLLADIIVDEKEMATETDAALKQDLREIAIEKCVEMMVGGGLESHREQLGEDAVHGPEPRPANDVEDGEITEGDNAAMQIDELNSILVPPPPPPPPPPQEILKDGQIAEEPIPEQDSQKSEDDRKSVDLDNTPSWPDDLEFAEKGADPEEEVAEADLRPEDDAFYAEMADHEVIESPERPPPPTARPPPGITGREGSDSPYGYDYEGYNSDLEEGEMVEGDSDCVPPGMGPDKPMLPVVKALLNVGKGETSASGSGSPSSSTRKKGVKTSIVPIKTLYNQLKAQREQANKKPKIYTAEPRTQEEEKEEQIKKPPKPEKVNRPMSPPPMNDWEIQQEKEAELKIEKEKEEKLKKKKHKSVELTSDFLARLEKQQRKHEENIKKKLETLEELKKKRVEKSLVEKEVRDKIVSSKLAQAESQTIDISDADEPGPSSSRATHEPGPSSSRATHEPGPSSSRATHKGKHKEKYIKREQSSYSPEYSDELSQRSSYKNKKNVRPMKREEYYSSDSSMDTDERYQQSVHENRDVHSKKMYSSYAPQRTYYAPQRYESNERKAYKMKDAFGIRRNEQADVYREPYAREQIQPPRYTSRYETADPIRRYKYGRPPSRVETADPVRRYKYERPPSRSRSPVRLSVRSTEQNKTERPRPILKSRRRSPSSELSPLTPPTPQRKQRERVKFKSEPETQRPDPPPVATQRPDPPPVATETVQDEPKFELWELEMRARAIKALMQRNNDDEEED